MPSFLIQVSWLVSNPQTLGRHKSQFESTRFELKFNQRPNLATKFQQEVTKSLST